VIVRYTTCQQCACVDHCAETLSKDLHRCISRMSSNNTKRDVSRTVPRGKEAATVTHVIS
jgi:hypothetical protein